MVATVDSSAKMPSIESNATVSRVSTPSVYSSDEMLKIDPHGEIQDRGGTRPSVLRSSSH